MQIKSSFREPYGLEVINMEEFRHQPKEMVRIINQVPEVRIRQDGGLGSNHNMMIDGIGGRGVRIFLNDIPVYLPGPTYAIISQSELSRYKEKHKVIS
ncbi:MAG: TonB-dependent receptor plug domain-containing protein, partial [Bacteroidota bacterium]